MKQGHKNQCKCFYCTHTQEEIEQVHKESLKKFGYWVDGLMNDFRCPYGFNFHTHGLPESFQHPDIQICLPIDTDLVMSIIDYIVGYIKNGRKFESGVKYTDTDPGPMHFIDAFEDDRLVLRLLIPDSDGEFKGAFAKQLTMLECI